MWALREVSEACTGLKAQPATVQAHRGVKSTEARVGSSSNPSHLATTKLQTNVLACTSTGNPVQSDNYSFGGKRNAAKVFRRQLSMLRNTQPSRR